MEVMAVGIAKSVERKAGCETLYIGAAQRPLHLPAISPHDAH